MSSEHPRFLWSPARIVAVLVVIAVTGCSDKSIDDNRGVAELIPDVPYDAYPVWSPNGDWIAYEHRNNSWGDTDTSGIYLICPDGSGKTLLVPRGIQPAWHPSGSALAFSHHGGIWTYDFESHSFSLLISSSAAGFPSYSPDGSKLSFSKADSLCVHDFSKDSSYVLRDSTNSPILAILASWNPVDGRLIFHRRKAYQNIWAYDPESRQLQMLIAYGSNPRWSADGRKVCYNGENQGISIYDLETGTTIYIVRLFEPCFSPNGNQLVGRRLVGSLDEPYSARDRLFIYDLITKELTQLTH